MTKEREGQSERSAFFDKVEWSQKKDQLVELEKNAGQKVDHSDIWKIQSRWTTWKKYRWIEIPTKDAIRLEKLKHSNNDG